MAQASGVGLTRGRVAARPDPRAVRLRRAGPADAAGISRLTIALIGKFVGQEGAFPLVRSAMPSAVEESLRDGVVSHVALAGGDIVGVVAVRDRRQLEYLYVAESHQRLGLGRRLLDAARAAAIASGGSGELAVTASRYSLTFYRRLGFVQCGPDRRRNGVRVQPMVLAAGVY